MFEHGDFTLGQDKKPLAGTVEAILMSGQRREADSIRRVKEKPMRRTLVAILVAAAATLGVRQMAFAADDWSGFYIGVNGGYGWNSGTIGYSANDPAALAGTCGGVGLGTCIPSARYDSKGGLVGGQVGYNWRLNTNFLAGVEADYDWADISGSGSSNFWLGSVGSATSPASVSVRSFGTLRARVGFIPTNSLLVYATGGLAVGDTRADFVVPNVYVGLGSEIAGGFGYQCAGGGPPCFAGSRSALSTGWALGAGAEYKLTSNISLKGEYLYVNLGDPSVRSVAPNADGAAQPASLTAKFAAAAFNVVRLGLNYKF